MNQNIAKVSMLNPRLMGAAISALDIARQEGVELCFNPAKSSKTKATFFIREKGKPASATKKVTEMLEKAAARNKFVTAKAGTLVEAKSEAAANDSDKA